jgi:hypothetical protein
MVEQVQSQDSRQEEDVASTIAEAFLNLEHGSQHNDYATYQEDSLSATLERRSRTSSIPPIQAGRDESEWDELRPQSYLHDDCSPYEFACALLTHFHHQRDARIFAKKVNSYREAHLLRPQGHRNRSSSLVNLANTLKPQYEQDGNTAELTDLEAVDLHCEALPRRVRQQIFC